MESVSKYYKEMLSVKRVDDFKKEQQYRIKSFKNMQNDDCIEHIISDGSSEPNKSST